ncbi:chromosome segregation protein SMC [Alteromonas halophila]|uniref:Chromosome partition protein Smc n=1 Tax=Alteromonas halophila TaxID=516698 RepID=A0A918JLW2_9ALTE|nr:chromosome segregation protein SMC [Alteromonas halophila]GGW87802.1 chromosome partition protein Smc [Alteromonas halophila]
MRLKKIKLAGFKSFVDPTSIPFPGDMTAIVGPNGCGKSNVIDAVRWVLGESSAKNLRGDAMTDVIFNGSSARKPVGQCSVELIFDNSSGRLGGEYAGFVELSVKRLVTRDAQSTYFLNGTKCRRRDVTDLFLGTGLGPRSYAIIEQGMISRLIESRPQELRVFIEEAAGISKYKERRRETENRIRHTQDNLERLEDVRSELGQQLEKLQRQAAAANRYKTYRAKIRELKGQLAAIRYLTMSAQTEKLEQQRNDEQRELDALVAEQRGDEAGIERFRSQQQAAKDELDRLQQALFTAATAITRLEQNTLHGKQRYQQIDTERRQLREQMQVLEDSLKDAREAYSDADKACRELEPRQELLIAQLEQAQEKLDTDEQALREFSAQSRDKEQAYLQAKQQSQTCHSQIQSTMSMQLRTTQRISELNDEIAGLDSDDLQQQKALIDASLDEAADTLTDVEAKWRQAQTDTASAQQAHQASLGVVDEHKSERQRLSSTIAALQALQEDDVPVAADNDAFSALWQHLTVKTGDESLLEFVLRVMGDPLIADTLNDDALLGATPRVPQGKPVWLGGDGQPVKPGTLAACLEGGFIPAGFNDIYVYDSIEDGAQKRAALSGGQQIVTRDGYYLTRHSVLFGQADKQEGALQRAARLASLNDELAMTQAALEESENIAEDCESALKECRAQEDALSEQRQHTSNQVQQLQNQQGMLDMQVTQSASRTQKLNDELHRQQQLLDEENSQLETLSAKLEGLEEDILHFETDMQQVQTQRDTLERAVEEGRTRHRQLSEEKHSLDLNLSQQQNQRTLYAQQVERNEKQRQDYQARDKQLLEEQETLLQPLEDQQLELQALLDEKVATEAKRTEAQTELDNVEALLKEAEQGQQGVAEKIQQRQAKIDSLRIEIEGSRVRASAVLEKLDEAGTTLKAVLDTLPEEASEDTWQAELDKAQAAINRLGAVNLAAVEEYETQSTRKAHLDAQHQDLTDALETLQSAIRKIDKETRSRFSATFEQVNDDLKQLFPKVFGGGSAYLDLTDDDLLETGVTIMARPPGKKNSTIHLLSGGEKALTALSLVFAIFRLNPAPFCLLDEVDAPLDDANVGRFCNLVSEMSQTVQFIYITHNKIAMEMAAHLTGVTMAEPGVSRMVAVDVDEAIAFAEA